MSEARIPVNTKGSCFLKGVYKILINAYVGSCGSPLAFVIVIVVVLVRLSVEAVEALVVVVFAAVVVEVVSVVIVVLVVAVVVFVVVRSGGLCLRRQHVSIPCRSCCNVGLLSLTGCRCDRCSFV